MAAYRVEMSAGRPAASWRAAAAAAAAAGWLARARRNAVTAMQAAHVQAERQRQEEDRQGGTSGKQWTESVSIFIRDQSPIPSREERLPFQPFGDLNMLVYHTRFGSCVLFGCLPLCFPSVRRLPACATERAQADAYIIYSPRKKRMFARSFLQLQVALSLD